MWLGLGPGICTSCWSCEMAADKRTRRQRQLWTKDALRRLSLRRSRRRSISPRLTANALPNFNFFPLGIFFLAQELICMWILPPGSLLPAPKQVCSWYVCARDLQLLPQFPCFVSNFCTLFLMRNGNSPLFSCLSGHL